MATPASPEAIEIRRRGRQRLVGAIAIVVLLVVFVPMLLDSEPRSPRNEPSMQIPPKDKAPPLPAPSPASHPADAAPAAAKEPPDVARVMPPAGPKPAPAPAKPAPAAAPAAKPAPAAAPRLEGFAVQVGAFRDEETLRQARAKLAAAGISHYTERVDNGELTRLRAGPFPTREAAEKALAALERASLDGQVVPLP
jgi:DedD protein